jgi:hypothetical protein
MSLIKKFFLAVNENLFFILSVFLLIFIPLFPKIPLFDILPGYIVRVRPEDLLVLCAAFVWLRDVRTVLREHEPGFCVFYACWSSSIVLGVFC